ncbi:MAG: hypothetical protein JWN03_4299 [Nocardia sp.]|nr:hypothetical protein [Nocardia sp.]
MMSDNDSEIRSGGDDPPASELGPQRDGRESARRAYASKFDVPQALRAGAIAYRFGSNDIDAVQATKLRAVQNFAALRSAWMRNAVENDLDFGDRKHRWAMFVNGVGEDLQQARAEAVHAGIDAAEIEDAENAGSSGVSWDQQPAHRRLGRLEQLSEQLYHAESQAAEQREQVQDLTRRLETAQAAIDALGDHLTRNENSLRELLGDLVDADWQGPAPRKDPIPGLQSLTKLQNANVTLLLANLFDKSEPVSVTDEQLAVGRGISAAVEATLTDTDSPLHHDENPAPGPEHSTPPSADPGSGVGP